MKPRDLFAPNTTTCRGCGKTAPASGFCISGVRRLHGFAKPQLGLVGERAFLLTSRCRARWQLKNWQRMAPLWLPPKEA